MNENELTPNNNSAVKLKQGHVVDQDFELVRQAVLNLKMGLLELFNELAAVDVVGGEPMPGSHKAQSGGRMGLVYPGRVEEGAAGGGAKTKAYPRLYIRNVLY